jgi:hypothetical protein
VELPASDPHGVASLRAGQAHAIPGTEAHGAEAGGMSIVAVERDAAGLPVRLVMGTRRRTASERAAWLFRYRAWTWLLLGSEGRARVGSRLTEAQQRSVGKQQGELF